MKQAAVIATCLALGAASAAAGTVPIPTPRPAGAAQPAVAAPVPIPRLRPSGSKRAAPAIPKPQLQPEPAPAPPLQEPTENAPKAAPEPVPGGGGWPADEVAAGRAECKSLLAGLDITYRDLPPIGQQGGCGAPAPVEITRVGGVALTPPATETCAMAAALAAWVSEDVQPAARTVLGTELTEIRTATSYACRYRNNASSGKMSEHSKANALDMSGFTFAKKTAVTVGAKGNWGESVAAALGVSKDGSFLEAVRKAACTHFTTVLGPGSDPYHGDHFHVDVLQRKGNYRICQ